MGEYSHSGSFRAKDNRAAEEKELIKLRKENQQLKIENDILKQAALIDNALETFGNNRSLSNKVSPYDNAVTEATFKSIKTKFVYGLMFSCQQELDPELFDYVNKFNNIRIHGFLNDQSPVEYKRTNL